jgi:glutamine synthetase
VTPQEVFQFIKANNIQIIDLKFIDLPGLWQHFSVPVSELTEDVYVNGLGFDGSSIRGFQKIQESDMLLVPDPTTAVLDPATQVPTLSIICNVVDPLSRQRYSRDPRHVANKAEDYLRSTGIGDTVYFGPEAEFFIFDDVRFDQTMNSAFYRVDSDEAAGTAAVTRPATTPPTRCGSRKATSPSRRTTRCRISAARWCWP